MTRILSSAELAPGTIKPFTGKTAMRDGIPNVPPAPRDLELEALRRKAAALEQKVQERDGEIDRLGQDLKAQSDAAFQRGLEAGRAEAGDGRREQASIVQRGISTALDRLTTSFTRLDGLAPQLAVNCLERVFAESSRSTDVAAAIRVQLRAIEGRSVLAVSVHPSLASELSGLLASSGMSVCLEPDADLELGACHIRLDLGMMAVGPVQQWRRLRASLLEMVDTVA